MNRIALVTGGSGGIGREICTRLAADDCTVYVGYASGEERASALVEQLGGSPHRILQTDVTDAVSLAAAADVIADEHGRLDVLVNCGGVTRGVAHNDLDGLDDELIDRIFQINWRGPFATIRAMEDLLRSADGAVVVNISSIAGVTGVGSNVAYCASKAALDSMTRSLARALAPAIRVVSVSPGWVLGEYAATMDPEMLQAQRDATPLGTLASGADVAAAVSAVVHHLPLTTGSIIPVDGGRPLGT